MKKLVSIILCLILSISTATLLTGCSPTIFDGEYREVDLSEIETLLPEIKSANKDYSIDFASGVSLYMNVILSTEKRTLNENLNMQSTMVNGLLRTKGKVISRDNYTDISDQYVVRTNFYCENNTSYVALTQNDETVKIKYFQSILVSLAETLDPIMEYMSIENFVALTRVNTAKWCIDDTSDVLKIKLEYKESNENLKTIWIFNAEYKLTAFSITASESVENYSTTKTTFSFQPWTGTIETPGDLDEYQPIPNPF